MIRHTVSSGVVNEPPTIFASRVLMPELLNAETAKKKPVHLMRKRSQLEAITDTHTMKIFRFQASRVITNHGFSPLDSASDALLFAT